MLPTRKYERPIEALLLAMAILVALLGFTLTSLALHLQDGDNPLTGLPGALALPVLLGLLFSGVHVLLLRRQVQGEELLLPAVALLFSLGMIMIFRLRGAEGAWQQFLRGFLPGILIVGAFLVYPRLNEQVRQWAVPISLVGLGLAFITGLFGVMDETGTRLALKLGPLPAIQISEIIKLALIIFLAWFIDQEGVKMEGRSRVLFGRLRIPSLRYFLPGLLFVALATLALVRMSDFGAVLILGCIFFAMLYAGFDPRLFATVAAIAVAMAVVVGLVLVFAWHVPSVIQNRILAYRDPWSTAQLMVNGAPSGVTIAEGPGYQIQQSIYAVVAGGLSGTGLGFGTPDFIPLAASDFVFAALLEEMGSVMGVAVLAFYMLLVLRLFRVALMLPRAQVFERLLLVGIAIHFFTQVFIMIGGTLNLIPMTGVTLPFLSLGGSALMTNLAEVGIALGLAQRLEVRRA